MPRKRFIGFARVSSREQAVEGHGLEPQEEAIRAYAERNGGDLVRFWSIAETASKRQKRTTFQEIVRYAKKHAEQLDGMLFFKVDRAARNLADFVTLEQIESDFDVPFISVTQSRPSEAVLPRILAVTPVWEYAPQERAEDIRPRRAKEHASKRSPSKTKRTAR
jgi:DNA invertase Pin-like site-specific DNA recombinase